MRQRRRYAEEHDNQDRWLVSYADFVTLLLAFFVVMYAISSVNEGKYRVLSDTLNAIFQVRDRSASIVNLGAPARTPVAIPHAEYPGAEVGKSSLSSSRAEAEAALQQAEQDPTQAIEDPNIMAQAVHEALAAVVSRGWVDVKQGAEWVEVEMKSQILFASGSAALASEAVPVLSEVAKALNEFSNPLQVEGYTDNTPIGTAQFPSNWELSAARAASVVHLFSTLGVSPSRMAAVGYGEFRPKAENADAAGRQQNRRVVVRISTRALDLPKQAAPASGVPATD